MERRSHVLTRRCGVTFIPIEADDRKRRSPCKRNRCLRDNGTEISLNGAGELFTTLSEIFPLLTSHSAPVLG
jgi:hypothetical protein